MADLPGRQERLLKQIIGTKRCKVCRSSFHREHVRVAARHDQLWLVSVRCGRCRNQQVYWIEPDQDVPEAVLEDVVAAERDTVSSDAPVTADDVLDMHTFLSTFRGNFKRLFGE